MNSNRMFLRRAGGALLAVALGVLGSRARPAAAANRETRYPTEYDVKVHKAGGKVVVVPVPRQFESRTTGAALALKRVGVVRTLRRERGRDVLKAQFEDGREATFVDRTEFTAGEESYQALGWQRDQYRLRDMRTGEIQALTRNAPR